MTDNKPEFIGFVPAPDSQFNRDQAQLLEHQAQQRAIVSQSQVDALVRIEAKLDRVLAFIEEAQPLIEAGQDMAETMAEQGPMGLLAGFLKGG